MDMNGRGAGFRRTNTLGNNIAISVTPSDDARSYHVSSSKIKRELGFKARQSLENAILDLKNAFGRGLIPNPMDSERYYNIKTMKATSLT